MLSQLQYFKTSNEAVSCIPHGRGHINETYLVQDASHNHYILQKINTGIFCNPEALMHNVEAVINHLKQSSLTGRDTLTLVPTTTQKNWLVDEQSAYWRMYVSIKDSICIEQAPTPEVFKESAYAFGLFQRRMANFDASVLTETIPYFHDTPKRYRALHEAIKADTYERVKTAQKEISFALSREEYASTLIALQQQGVLPLRTTHNDTKLNNVLFDKSSLKALCVIDLDTVMPGLLVNDFGDSVRFGATTGAEDEVNLNKVNFSLKLYEAYTKGFLHACGESITPGELNYLRDGAKMMTLECGVRFLTDYLCGDTYFKAQRQQHNLHRCRTQFKLVTDMEQNWERMLYSNLTNCSPIVFAQTALNHRDLHSKSDNNF